MFPKTESEWAALSPQTKQVLKGVLVLTLPNPEGLDEEALFLVGKELLLAGAIRLVVEDEGFGIEAVLPQ